MRGAPPDSHSEESGGSVDRGMPAACPLAMDAAAAETRSAFPHAGATGRGQGLEDLRRSKVSLLEGTNRRAAAYSE